MRSNRRFLSVGFSVCLGFFAVLGMGFAGCGGGGGGGGPAPPPPTATIQGSVAGTIVMAIDETGKIVDQDDTAGKTPLPGTSPPQYPFTLIVPVGHQYRIQFIVGEGTPSQQIVPLALGSSDIFSVTSSGTVNLGYVDTSQATAVADNNTLTPAGQAGPRTILVDGYRYFIFLDNTAGAKMYRAQLQLKNPDNTVLTNRSLVKDMKVYDNTWTELVLGEPFYFWDGTSVYQNPQADVEGILQASPGTLPPGFYSVVLTDNNGNLYATPVYLGTPVEVSKATNLQQQNNQDNSITLTWTNPTIPTGRESEYFLMVHVLCNDLNADGLPDSLYFFAVGLPTVSHTLPPSFVSSVLPGKPGLRWRVEVRQRTPAPITFPDGYVTQAQFYRTYSAESPLTLTGEPLKFTTGMLSGKVFYSGFVEPAGFVANLLFFNADGSIRVDLTDDVGTETATGSWSINGAGQVIANIQGGITTVTLLSDSSTQMTVSVDEGTGTPQDQILQKTVPVVASKLPGTYVVDHGDVMTFNSNSTGTSNLLGNFTWDVAGGRLLITWVAAGGSSTESYALASSTSTDTGYISLRMGGKDIENGVVVLVYPWTLEPQTQ